MSTTDELWLKRARHLQTEEEWRSWEFLNPLTRLIDQARVGDRKLRLFTAACVRCLSGGPYQGEHGWIANALEQGWIANALERQADAPLTPKEVQPIAVALRELRLQCTDVMGGMYWQASIDYPEEPETNPWQIAWGTADAVIVAVGRRSRVAAGLPDERPEEEHRAVGERAVCDLVRDIFGNPFRQVTLDPAWLRWHDATILRLAQQMYDSRDYTSMPVLADALEEAGCTSADILDHCRGAGPHVRGCWVVDFALGKE